MCNCGGGGSNVRWLVTYPAGTGPGGITTETKTSAVAARIAASKVAGATWTRAV